MQINNPNPFKMPTEYEFWVIEQPLYADSAYRSEEIEQELVGKGIESDVHEKATETGPSPEGRYKGTGRSNTSAQVEPIFALMGDSMNGMYIKCRSGCKNGGNNWVDEPDL